MRLLTVVAPGGGETCAAVSAALAEWNRGLDIRLRFLNIGVEETVLDLGEGPAAAAPEEGLAAVEKALARTAADVLLLHGNGPAALAAAVTAAKRAVPVVRTGAGRRAGADGHGERAADRLAAVRLGADGDALARLEEEGLAGEPLSPGAVVKAVIRVLRES